MDRKPASPGGPGEGGTAGAPEGPAEDVTAAGPERFGPLELNRLSKDDGRALLVFTRDVRPP
jgi:hypothetical protein